MRATWTWVAAAVCWACVVPAAAADAPVTAPGSSAPGASAATPPPKGAPPPAAGDPLDYTTLTHVLAIDMLRAGSHDQSGTNDYYFTVTMYGLLNNAEERNLDFAKRKQVKVDVGHFGSTKIDSLAVWRPDEKTKDTKELRIDGNGVRELAARTMTEFSVQEGDVTVMVEIALIKRNKKFLFFGDDQPLAHAAYYPIPPTKFDTQVRTNQTLMITDDKGTSVRVSVRYEKPAAAAKKT